MTLRSLTVVFLLASGCVGQAATVIANTAVAATVSGVRRANGECYTVCNPGSRCNKGTGMCEPIPCAGGCAFDEECQLTPTGEACVPRKIVQSPFK